MKECRECHRPLPLDAFYAHSKMADGRLNKCVDCVKARVTTYRKTNLGRVKAYDRTRAELPQRVQARAEYRKTDRGKERLRVGQAAWDARNKHKKLAHTLVATAVRSGLLVIPSQCQNPTCNSFGPLEGHHEDYSKPLEVRWLCVPCHRAHHIAERQQRAA